MKLKDLKNLSILDYIKNNNFDANNKSHMQEAGEYALLNLYGNIINLTKRKTGDSANASILKLDVNKKVKYSKPC